MWHNPTFTPDRGGQLMEKAGEDHRSNEKRIIALEAELSALTVKVQQIIAHLRSRGWHNAPP